MKPSIVGRLELRTARPFAMLDDGSLDAILSCATFRDLDAGATLFEQGEPGDTMVIVLKGALSVELVAAHGQRVSLAHVRAGELMGEMACMDPAPRAASVRATEPTRVCEIRRANLAVLREHAPRAFSTIVGEVIREVTRRLRDVDAQIQDEIAPRVSVVPASVAPATRRSAPSTRTPPASTPTPTSTPKPSGGGLFGWVKSLRGHT